MKERDTLPPQRHADKIGGRGPVLPRLLVVVTGLHLRHSRSHYGLNAASAAPLRVISPRRRAQDLVRRSGIAPDPAASETAGLLIPHRREFWYPRKDLHLRRFV